MKNLVDFVNEAQKSTLSLIIHNVKDEYKNGEFVTKKEY